jgi:hypothetical protein
MPTTIVGRFFYLFECLQEKTAAGAFYAGLDWARSCDLVEVIGPKVSRLDLVYLCVDMNIDRLASLITLSTILNILKQPVSSPWVNCSLDA